MLIVTTGHDLIIYYCFGRLKARHPPLRNFAPIWLLVRMSSIRLVWQDRLLVAGGDLARDLSLESHYLVARHSNGFRLSIVKILKKPQCGDSQNGRVQQVKETR